MIDAGLKANYETLQRDFDKPGGRREELSKNHMSPSEINAEKQRVDDIVSKANDLAAQGLVVKDWATWRDPGGTLTAPQYLAAKGGQDGYYNATKQEAIRR